MASSVWKGAISFGLVNVPVSLYSAVRSQPVRFHQLHREDGGRIQLRRVCSLDGKELGWDEVAKGYEVAKDDYVMVDDDEIAALEAKANEAIQIEDFVPGDQVDPVLYDRTYIVAPDKKVGAAYKLLLDAMLKEDKVGISQIVIRAKQHLCALRPTPDALMLTTLHYSHDLVSPVSVGVSPDQGEVGERERRMAEALIESLSGDFEPDRYQDEFKEAVHELVRAKSEGRETSPAQPAKRAAVIDLAKALEESLASTRSKRAGQDPKSPSAQSGPAKATSSKKTNPRAKSKPTRAAS